MEIISPTTQPHPLGHSLIDQLVSEAAAKGMTFRTTPMSGRHPDRIITEDEDPAAHLQLARSTPPPSMRSWEGEPTMDFAIDKLGQINKDITEWRDSILKELDQLQEDMADEFNAWWTTLDGEVSRAYGQGAINAPLFAHLLRRFNYPDAEALFDDLTNGFNLLGPVAPGVGWPSKSSDLPPWPNHVLHEHNDAYVKERLQHHRATKHHDAMLKELITECGSGKVEGPFALPPKWSQYARTQTIPGMTLLPAPTDTECTAAAFAFAVEQIGSDGSEKVRRAEDWKRSGHNRTTYARDKPVHHTVDHYIAVASRLHAQGWSDLHAWGHDHEGAYRMFPAAPPEYMWVFLEGPEGVSLWRHRVMIFGSKAAVWHYGRVGDAVTHLLRLLLAIAGMHYVDDYGGVEPIHSAASAFEAFERVGNVIGFKIKQSKRQPPAATQPMQGVELTLQTDVAIVAPTKRRRKKLLAAIRAIRAEEKLAPPLAESLAGKLNFYTTTTFGSSGVAALKPLYQRAHNADPQARFGKDHSLSPGLAAALPSLEWTLTFAPPRSTKLARTENDFSCLYADAFFESEAGEKFRPSELEGFPHEQITANPGSNGWGIVVIKGDRVWQTRGSAPASLMARLAKKKTYIFYLEALAQCLGAWLFEAELGEAYWAFVDNTGAEFALRKGYSKDADANRLTALFWATISDTGSCPWFERVASAAQVADGPSRGDMAWKLPGHCTTVDFDLTEIYRILGDNAGLIPSDAEIKHLRAEVQLARTRAGLS